MWLGDSECPEKIAVRLARRASKGQTTVLGREYEFQPHTIGLPGHHQIGPMAIRVHEPLPRPQQRLFFARQLVAQPRGSRVLRQIHLQLQLFAPVGYCRRDLVSSVSARLPEQPLNPPPLASIEPHSRLGLKIIEDLLKFVAVMAGDLDLINNVRWSLVEYANPKFSRILFGLGRHLGDKLGKMEAQVGKRRLYLVVKLLLRLAVKGRRFAFLPYRRLEFGRLLPGRRR